MGRATRWLKNILGMKKPHQPDKNDTENGRREKMGTEKKKRWSFRNKQSAQNEPNWLRDYNNEVEDEHSKQAMAVAAATAAAADAAAAAAQAAVEVVRLTAQHNRDAMLSGRREKLAWAAVKIQTLFRGYLARKALRALKALVKLQAHVRGYLVRKRAAATLHSMQALVRAQAAVRSRRADQTPKKSIKPPSEFRPRRSTGRLLDETGSEFHSKRIPSSSTLSYDQPNNANEGSPKIVEVDTCKPRSRSRRINPSLYDFTTEDFLQYPTISSPLPCPTLTRLAIPDPRNFHNHHHHQDYDYFYRDEYRPSTAQSTPWFGYSNRISGLETPTKSVCGESFFGPYCSNYPNYMAETHSFRAKLRALSAPKQRPDARSRKKLTLNEMLAARNSISGVRMHRSGPQVQEALNF